MNISDIVPNLFYNLGQAVRTQPVDGLLADLLQDVVFLGVWMSSLRCVLDLLSTIQVVIRFRSEKVKARVCM